MKKQIILQNKKVVYILRKSKRARRMRITVYYNGSIVVTMPHNLQETMVEKFIREKAQWLLSKISYFKQFKSRQITRYSHKDYLNYRDKAQILVEERIEYFNKRYSFCYSETKFRDIQTPFCYSEPEGSIYQTPFCYSEPEGSIYQTPFCYNKIKIKNQKTCWGSCSKKRNLNFNYKILFLGEKARDYIIVHELCHLKELNHSRNFWGLVAKIFPEWKEIKKELRNNVLNLH